MDILKKYILLLLFATFLSIPQTSCSQTQEEAEEIINRFAGTINQLQGEAKYEEALQVHIQLIEYMETYLKEEDLLLAYYLQTTGNLLAFMNRHNEAVNYYLKGLSILEENGIDDTSCPDLLSDIAEAYTRLIDFENALLYALRSAEVYAIESESREYGNIINKIGYIYLKKGDIKNALYYLENSKNILKKTAGESNSDYRHLLTHMSEAYVSLGMLEKSLELQQEGRDIIIKEYGKNSGQYADNLISTAVTYASLHDFENALACILKGIEIYKGLSMDGQYMYAAALHNYGCVYAMMGNYQQALIQFEGALKIHESNPEYKTIDYYTTITNIGNTYSKIGNYEKALEYYLIYKQAIIELLGENSLKHAYILNDLGSLYFENEEYSKAVECYETGIQILQNLDMTDHPLMSNLYNNSSFLFTKKKDMHMAVKRCIQAANIIYDLYGLDHPDINLYMSNLSSAYLSDENYYKASEAYWFIIPRLMREVSTNFLFMTEAEREKYWNITEFHRNKSYNNLYFYPAPQFIEVNYNLTLFAKGLLLNSSVEFSNLIRETGNTNTIKEYEQLKAIRANINYLYENPGQNIKEEIENMQQQAYSIERNLLEQAKKSGYYTDNLSVSWKDLREKMTKKDICIEFIEHQTDTYVNYSALIVCKEMEYPQYIPLFNLEELENIECDGVKVKEILNSGTPALINSLYSNEKAGQLIWNSLKKHMTGKENIYFAATGILHQLAIESLIVADGKRISDNFNSYRLSSTRELLTDVSAKPIKPGHAVLYGGLDYNTSPEMMLAYSQQYTTRSRIRLLNLEASQHQLLWRYLPGTRKEIRTTASILESMQFKTTVYTDTEGIEESVKALSGRSPQILHIATHGFYFPDESKYVKKNPFFQMEDSKDNSLYHSGLVFAGANNFRNRKDNGLAGIDDGILSAKEIAELDLRNTEMVVLSACQTGLGEITGEGVFGLQRAFKKAGAGTLLMSLWEVHDEATQVMMTEFYSAIAAGYKKREALYQAQQKVKERTFKMNGITYSGNDPYFWAGFIMLD